MIALSGQGPDLTPCWVDGALPPGGAQKGLLRQALEDGLITQELVMPEAVFRVTTRISFDAERAWLFRCAIDREGIEVDEEPWAPILRNLTPDIDAPSADQAAREALARQALETHLATYARFSSALQQGEGPGQSPVPRRLEPRYGWAALGAALGLSIAVGMYQGWQTELRWWHDWVDALRSPSVARPDLSAVLLGEGPEPAESSSDMLPSARADRTESLPVRALDPLSEPSSARSSEPGPSIPKSASPPAGSVGARTKTTPPVRLEPPPERQAELSGRQTTSPTAAPTTISPVASGSSTGSPVAQPSVTREPVAAPSASRPVPPAASRASERMTQSRRNTHRRASEPFDSVRPSEHRIVRLQPGEKLYADADIRVAQGPATVGNLVCVTTDSRQGDGEHGIFFTVTEPQEIYVAHDRRVKKKPQWLGAFRLLTDTLVAQEVDKGRLIEYALYRKQLSGEAVALGANTGSKRVTKRLRELVPKKKIVMYLACVADR